MKYKHWSRLLVALVFAIIGFSGFAGAIDIFDVGTTGIADDPNVELINRGDGSYALVFTNPQTTTFTFKNQFVVTEALIVGGGGSGGSDCGSGGGAGALIYLKNREIGVAVGDTLNIKVGAGGAMFTNTSGVPSNPGEASSLTLDGQTYIAYGGGGGCHWNKLVQAEGVGGTGSGAGAQGGNGKKEKSGTPGQSTMAAVVTDDYECRVNAGGYAWGETFGGGGGGAGGAGYDGSSQGGGNGGDGYPVSITGNEVYYAAGGGGGKKGSGGVYAKGGRGGGGDGWNGRNPGGGFDATGYGCGGGGGSSGNQINIGGAGSAGIVVLAIRPDTSVTVAAVLRGDPGMNFFKMDLTPSSDGDDGMGAVALRGGWSLDSTAIPDNEIAASVPVLTAYPLTVTGLQPGGTYYYSFYSQNSKGEKSKTATGRVVLTSGAIGGAPGFGGTVTKLANGDAVHVFTESGTLVLPEDYGSARALIVGGGGSGGGNCGGGGGAGGFVELDNLNLTAGSYAVTVGAGGVMTTKNSTGVNGEDSTLTIGDVVYRALGGGGGAAWGQNGYKANPGGSGGGTCVLSQNAASTQFSTTGYGLGSVGGAGGNSGGDRGGGGGGAGGAGGNANGSISGSGGLGKSSDITGDTVFYAAGGGAGGSGGTPGAGGSGIGGKGGEGGDLSQGGNGYGYPAEDGTGSGGGGSAGGSGIGGFGGAGGSGIVIVRYHYTKDVSDQDEPSVSFGLGTLSGNAVTIPYAIAWPGKGKATCSAKILYGLAADDLRYEQNLGAGRIGEETATLGNLIPGRHYYLKIVVSNGDYSVESDVMDFDVASTAPAPTAYPVGMPVIAGDGSGCVTAAGEDATFAGVFAQYVEGTVVTLHYLDGETWREVTADSVSADGFSGSFTGVTTGIRYPYYLTAEAPTGIDRTAQKSFLVGGTVKLAKAVSVSNPTCEITVTGSLERYEVEDPVTVTLMIRINGVWTPCGSKQLQQAGEFAITYDGNGTFAFGESYDVKFMLASQESDTATFAAQDTLTYTWRNRDGERYWNDPDNWQPSDSTVTGAGYPVLGSTAKFANSAETTVRIARAETAALVDFADTKYVRLFGTTDDAAVTADLRTAGSVAVILDHVAVSEVKTGNMQDPYHGFADNGEFALVNGAELNARGNWMPFSNGFVFRVASGSTFRLLSGANNFWFGGNGTRFVLDDATAVFETTFDLNNKAAGDSRIEIKGANAQLICNAGLRYIGSDMSPTTILFDIPTAGFAQTPIEVNGNFAFPGSGNATVTVDSCSAFLQDFTKTQQTLVQFGAGVTVDTAATVLDEKSALTETELYRAAMQMSYDDGTSPTNIRVDLELEAKDESKEVVVADGEITTQTSTAIMQAVTAGGKALTANTPKLREFLTANGVGAYTASHTTAAAISAALAEVPTVEGNNGLALWKDYALGITPTTSVKAVADAAKDTDPNAITLAIPTIDPQKASGDFTVSYQVTDRNTKELKTTAVDPNAIKIPLATGVYDVKIDFVPAT